MKESKRWGKFNGEIKGRTQSTRGEGKGGGGKRLSEALCGTPTALLLLNIRILPMFGFLNVWLYSNWVCW
jgi:hypothetical protein